MKTFFICLRNFSSEESGELMRIPPRWKTLAEAVL